jgi:hypothetical protein
MNDQPRFYGQWAGDKKGVPEDKTRCIQEIWPSSGSWVPYQCPRKRGYGKDGLYCKQHAKRHPASEAEQQ